MMLKYAALLLLALSLSLATTSAAHAQPPIPEPTPFPIPSTAPEERPSMIDVGQQFSSASQQGVYQALYMVTQGLWLWNKFYFSMGDTIRDADDTIIDVFTSVLTLVFTALEGPAMAGNILAVVLAIFGLLLGGVFMFNIASLRGVVVALVVSAAVLGGLGVTYTRANALRASMGEAMISTVLRSMQEQLAPGQGAFAPEYDGTNPNPVATMAASAIYVTRADVELDGGTLPPRFVERFLVVPPDNWMTIKPEARQAYIAQTGNAATRMGFAIIPSALYVAHMSLQLAFSVWLAVLVLDFGFSLAFSGFSVMSARASNTLLHLMTFYLQTTFISIIQAFLLGLVMYNSLTFMAFISWASLAFFVNVVIVICILLNLATSLFNAATTPFPAGEAAMTRALNMLVPGRGIRR